MERKTNSLAGKQADCWATTIYVYRDKTCKLPVAEVGRALEQIWK